MPTSALRICNGPKCYHLVGPGRPCPIHPARRPWAARASARARGYTSAWDKAAKTMRERADLCAYCGMRTAVELDHRTPLSRGGSTDPNENGVPACVECHKAKSNSEKRGDISAIRGTQVPIR